VYSQGTTEAKLISIVQRLNIVRGSALEIGAGDGIQDSNTRWFYEHEWDCRFIEADRSKYRLLVGNVNPTKCMRARVGLEAGCTLDELTTVAGCPEDLTLLSLDIDGNDYWVWRSTVKYVPTIVCVEYNSNFQPDERRTIAYDPEFVWRGGPYYGASAGALVTLGNAKGYTLVDYDDGLNLLFVLERVRPPSLPQLLVERIPYKPMNAGRAENRLMMEAPTI